MGHNTENLRAVLRDLLPSKCRALLVPYLKARQDHIAMTSEPGAVTGICERALPVRSESVHRADSLGWSRVAAQLARSPSRRGMGAGLRDGDGSSSLRWLTVLWSRGSE